MGTRLDEAAMVALLRARYPADKYAFFAGVRDAPGFDATRTLDALAMGLWPSAGLDIHGFEVKVSRSDWLRELRQPSKAGTFIEKVDRFWFAVADNSIVRDLELPQGCGLLVATPAGGLRVRVEAPKLSPQPIGRQFLASILRHAMLASPGELAIRAAVGKAVAEERKRQESLRGPIGGSAL